MKILGVDVVLDVDSRYLEMVVLLAIDLTELFGLDRYRLRGSERRKKRDRVDSSYEDSLLVPSCRSNRVAVVEFAELPSSMHLVWIVLDDCWMIDWLVVN